MFQCLYLEREKIYGNDASNNLSYHKMLRAMDLLHVREEYVDEETKEVKLRKRKLFKTKTGWPQCCRRQKRQSDFQEYGVGSVLYFQFLKYFGSPVLLHDPARHPFHALLFLRHGG